MRVDIRNWRYGSRSSLSYDSSIRRPSLPRYQDWQSLRYTFKRDLNIFSLRRMPRIKGKNYDRAKCGRMRKQETFRIDRNLLQTSWSAKQLYPQKDQHSKSTKCEPKEKEKYNFGIFTPFIRKINTNKQKLLYEKSLACAISKQKSNKALKQIEQSNMHRKSRSLGSQINHTKLQLRQIDYLIRAKSEIRIKRFEQGIILITKTFYYDALSTKKQEVSYAQQSCLICQQQLLPVHYIIISPQCDHCFHEYCLKTYYFYYKQCPFHLPQGHYV